MLGANGCGAAAVHVAATPIRFDTAVPGDLLTRLTWRSSRGAFRGLKFVVDGRLKHSVGLRSRVYRLTEEPADEMAAPVDGS